MRGRQHRREEVVGILNTVAGPAVNVDGLDDDTNLIDAVLSREQS